MSYLYHHVPKNQQGDTLYPLNILKHKYPEAYKEHIKKYEGREFVMQNKIPILDCLWNDVLHFSAVSPLEVKNALVEAGFDEKKDLKCRDFGNNFYMIDPKLLDPNNTIVYLYSHTKPEDKMKKENFASYDPSDIGKYSKIPQETKDYYKEMYSRGERPFLYHRIPHILYRGELDVELASVILI